MARFAIPQRHLWRLAVLATAALLAACAMPGDAAPVVKIGLIAPFEGLGRPLGYELLSVVRETIADANASGAFGRFRVALVALNDDLDPSIAARQAQALAQDSDVLAVIGPFDQATAAAAVPILSKAGIPTLVVAPLAQQYPGVRSLCPPATEIERALAEAAARLSARGLSPSLVHFPGNAESAAEAVSRHRAEGGSGELLAGPDVVRPWFIQRAGPAAEGTLAAVCELTDEPAGAQVLPVVGLTRAGLAVLVEVLSATAAGGELSRPAVAATLAAAWSGERYGPGQATASGAQIAPRLRWYRVAGGQWRAAQDE